MSNLLQSGELPVHAALMLLVPTLRPLFWSLLRLSICLTGMWDDAIEGFTSTRRVCSWDELLFMLQALLRIYIYITQGLFLFFLIAIFFHCRLSDVNLGRLVRGDAYDCLVSPTACAVLELLEDLGASFCPNYSINSNVTKILMLSVLVLTKTNIISSSFVF